MLVRIINTHHDVVVSTLLSDTGLRFARVGILMGGIFFLLIF